MAFNGYLTGQEINALTEAAVQGDVLAMPRQALLAGLPRAFAAALPQVGNPYDQFVLDLVQTNAVERMAGGEIPVQTILQNIAQRLRLLDRAEARAFEQVLSRVGNAAAGVPPLPEPAQLPEVVKNERIIGADDTVDIRFLTDGIEVAQSVALISVARFENGQPVAAGDGPWLSRGTAWLIAADLALTNHHVINARREGEADASEADFRLQAENAMLRFDFDTRDTDGLQVKAARLAAVSRSLDYALLELVASPARPIPRIAPSTIELDSTSRIVVNIVQHPRGEHKKVAFRNNLVSAADARIVRYFADTDQGSSGAPVCDDRWRVVALHRGARHVGGVQFQGKDEAYVNFGTQIQAILADISASDPLAASAIAAAQPG